MSLRKGIKKEEVPFYALPSRRKSSAEIIREAKAEVKSMAARRPITPFTRSSSMNDNSSNDSRPSSSVSHVSYSTESPQSRPLSSIRLKPLRAKSAGHREPIKDLHLEPTVVKTPLIDKKTGCKLIHRTSSGAGSGLLAPTQDSEQSSFEPDIASAADKVEENVTDKSNVLVEKNYSSSRMLSKKVSKGGKSKTVCMGNLLVGVQCPSGSETFEEPNKLADFEAEIQVILPVLAKFLTSGKQKNELHGMELITKLHQLIEEQDMYCHPFQNRFTLMKILFRLLNYNYPTLSLHVAKLVLEMKITDKNLSNVCKFLYKICHEEKNIIEFLACGILGHFLESLKGIAVQENPQALKYSVSLICLLSAKDLLLDVLGVFASQEVLLQHLTALNTIEDCNKNEEHCYMIIKIVTALRYLSDNDTIWPTLLDCKTCKLLVETLDLNQNNVQIVMTTIRLLSKIADSKCGCDAILTHDISCDILKKLVIIHKSQRFIYLQLTYIIGNLISHKYETALQFYAATDFINVLCSYLDEFTVKQIENASKKESFCKNQLYGSGDGVVDTTSTDLMTKIVRIFANMCLCPDVGHLISEDNRLITCVSNMINACKMIYSDEASEPLLCILIALNNVTYFVDSESDIVSLYVGTAEATISLLDESYSTDVRIEGCNVVQNLSRLPQVRSYILKSKLIPTFVSLLEEYEHRVAVCGYAVIMNLLIDKATKAPFYKEQGVTKLLHKLHLCLCRDWKTGALLCQILWNYCSTGENEARRKPLADLEIQHLIKVLQYATGASAVLKTDEKNSKRVWEEDFCPIAKKLLKLLHSFT